jgi:hypothetical protein
MHATIYANPSYNQVQKYDCWTEGLLNKMGSLGEGGDT